MQDENSELLGGWNKRVGSTVRDIRYTFMAFSIMLIGTGLCVLIDFINYSNLVLPIENIGVTLISYVVYMLGGGIIASIAKLTYHNLVEEGTEEERERGEKMAKTRLKWKIFIVTPQQKKVFL